MDKDGESFLEAVCEILKNGGVYGPEKLTTPVVQFHHPDALKALVDFSLDNSLGLSNDQLKTICEKVVKYSVKTSSGRFFNQLYSGVDCYGLAGSWMSEALNTNQYTYEVAPAFTLIEEAVLKKAIKLFGFPEDSDGIFCPGGSTSNMYGMVLARYKLFPQIKTTGMKNIPQIVAFTSADSHYSFTKGCHWLGIGTDNLIKVNTDSMGRMIPAELRIELTKAREAGSVPFVVNVTAGTTVLGAFDPIDEIADICEEFGVWMHVDACLGGTLLLSERYRSALKGIQRADSVSWNPHKFLGAPLQCSMFLVRHSRLMHNANCATANYLFQQDKFYDVNYDTGDKSVQCGRKVDAFKLWLMWKARGDNGLRALVDSSMKNMLYFKGLIEKRTGFELVSTGEQSMTVCFWYVPKIMRGIQRDEDWWTKMDKIIPKIKERMVLKGSLMVSYTPLKHKTIKNFFRVTVTCQPSLAESDMDFIADEIERCGEEINTNDLK